ncbi:MAG: CapA family protein [Gaiellaceae bacterium]
MRAPWAVAVAVRTVALAGRALPVAFATLAVAAGTLAVPSGASAALAVGEGATQPGSPPVRELAIVASGDLLIHQPVWAQALANGRGRYDFRPMFQAIRPIVRRADLAICHVETPMGAGALSGFPVFNSPPELARAIAWAGWDACTTASNHSVDRGLTGVTTTLRALERAGVRHAGTARSPRESNRILLLEAKGVRVALLSYTYGTNGIPAPTPWAVSLLSRARVAADARQARRLGADLVIASFHWGVEYVHEPTSEQRTLAHALLRRGTVDLILGQHAHVVQPIRRLHGRFVVFGEGNLLSAQSTACCPGPTQDGLIAVVRARTIGERVTVTRVDYVPVWVERPTFVVRPVRSSLAVLRRRGLAPSSLAAALATSWQRTTGVVGRTPWTRPLDGAP